MVVVPVLAVVPVAMWMGWLPITLDIYVLRKVGIGAIPELHLRKVGIPTLSANFGIVPGNSRIVQGKH